MNLRSITLSFCLIPFAAHALSEAISGMPDVMPDSTVGAKRSLTLDQATLHRYLSTIQRHPDLAQNDTVPVQNRTTQSRTIRVELPELNGVSLKHTVSDTSHPTSLFTLIPEKLNNLSKDHSLVRISRAFPDDDQLSFIYHLEDNKVTLISKETAINIHVQYPLQPDMDFPHILNPVISNEVLKGVQCLQDYTHLVGEAVPCNEGLFMRINPGLYEYTPTATINSDFQIVSIASGATVYALTENEQYIRYLHNGEVISATVCPSQHVDWQSDQPRCLFNHSEDEPSDMDGGENKKEQGNRDKEAKGENTGSSEQVSTPPATAFLTPNHTDDDDDDDNPNQKRPTDYNQGHRDHYQGDEEEARSGYEEPGDNALFYEYIEYGDAADQHAELFLSKGIRGRQRDKGLNSLKRDGRDGRNYQNRLSKRQRTPSDRQRHQSAERAGGKPKGRGGRGQYRPPKSHDKY